MFARAQLSSLCRTSLTRHVTRPSAASIRSYAKDTQKMAARGLPLSPVPDVNKDLEDEQFVECTGPLYSRGWGVVVGVQQLNNPDRLSTHQAFVAGLYLQKESVTQVVFPQTTKKFRFINWTNAAAFTNQVIELLTKEHYRGNVSLTENNVVVRFPGHCDRNSELLEITPRDLKASILVEELFSNFPADKRMPSLLRNHYERPLTVDEVEDAVLRHTRFIEKRATLAKERIEKREEKVAKRRAETEHANELAKTPKEEERLVHIPSAAEILTVMEEYTDAVAKKKTSKAEARAAKADATIEAPKQQEAEEKQ